MDSEHYAALLSFSALLSYKSKFTSRVVRQMTSKVVAMVEGYVYCVDCLPHAIASMLRYTRLTPSTPPPSKGNGESFSYFGVFWNDVMDNDMNFQKCSSLEAHFLVSSVISRADWENPPADSEKTKRLSM